MNSVTFKSTMLCPLEQSSKDGTLLISGTDIKAAYVLRQLTEVSPTELMAQHKEITVDIITYILMVASLILENAPIELEPLHVH